MVLLQFSILSEFDCSWSLQVILNSMHKFQPRIYLVKRCEGATGGPVTDVEKEKFRTFVFPETQFTAVTAYQNQLVSKTKTRTNTPEVTSRQIILHYC